MKTTLFLLILGVSMVISAQEQLPTTPKVSFGQDGKLYVNKELGVYLWLSTSPDKDAPKHLLQSEETKEYSNPMYFDTEGYNTVRSPSAVDPDTRKTIYPEQDIIFEVYADGEKPVSTLKKTKGHLIYQSGKLYGGKNIFYVINARDRISGIESTYFSINGQDYNKYTDTIKLMTEGENLLKVYSTDRVGNLEKPIEKKIIIDYSAPATSFEIKGDSKEKYVSANTKIELTSKDNLIGVKAIYYQINGGERRTYTGPIPANLLGADGVLSFYAIDYLNNKETPQNIGGNNSQGSQSGSNSNFEFYVDNAPPSLSLETEGPGSKGKYNYVSGKTKIKVNAEDDKSGVDRIHYSVNSNSIDKNYIDDGISFSDEGITYIRVDATDYVGNKSPTTTKLFYVDKTAPTSKYTILSPSHKVKDTTFVSRKSKISLSTNDNASGTRKTFYRINNASDIEYSGDFNLETAGLNTINFYSVDNVENKEKVQSFKVFVDNIAPDIFYHYSATPIGSKTVREKEYTIYPSDVKLYIAATDVNAGGEHIEYRINGGPVKTTNPIKGLAPGNYAVEVTAYDVLGNADNKEIKFSIE